MKEGPEKKNPTEARDTERRIRETLGGQRAIDTDYPYFPSDYTIPCLHIGAEKQLFLDNFILDHLDNVERLICRPERPEAPILNARDHPWELDDKVFPAAALHDEADGTFKMWYTQSTSSDPFGDVGMILCYAESTDCLHWEKPLSGRCLPYEDHAATNIVLEDSGHHIALVKNPDQRDPDRRFMMVYNPHDAARAKGRRIMSTMAVSADGLRWETVSEDSSQPHQHFQRAIWDESMQRWISYSQYSPHWNFLHRKRQIGRQESEDFSHWSPKQIVLSADWDPGLPPDVEFHDMSVRKVGGLYIGIVTEFHAEPIWCAFEQDNWRDTATATLSLYVSRDGVRWERASGTEPWAHTGPPGSYDHGFVCDTVAGQLVHAGKTHIVYSGRAEKQHWYGIKPPADKGAEAQFELVPAEIYGKREREHAARVRAAGKSPWDAITVGALILREDGWARLQPVGEEGKVVTRQFVFEGDRLSINAEVGDGCIRVEAVDPQFKPYEGFSRSECDPMTSATGTEQIWRLVSWRGSRDVRALWNRPVRLIFYLERAGLYGFQFFDRR